jgi:hypothetical protein
MLNNGQDPKPLPTTIFGWIVLGIVLIAAIILILLAFEGLQSTAKSWATSLF